jgi:Ser/Thr protein kinase RdoA (MazF antagonist)
VSHRIHGMDGTPAQPVWKPLSAAEAGEVLAAYIPGAGDASIVWRSPRPMSSAAIVDVAGRRLFVKRHSPEVRTAAHLRIEHRFSAWLRRRRVPVPAVLETTDSDTVVERSGGVYEVHQLVSGSDRYRDSMSWTPYQSTDDAGSAGRALARFHLAATGFDAGPHPLGVLTDSSQLICAPDPLAAVIAFVEDRPVVAGFLSQRDWRQELADALGPALDRAVDARLAEAPPLWTHGDWHPSNLSWDRTGVAGVFDLGLSNRTFAMHDLAVAVERSCVSWLDPSWQVDEAAVEALLCGYLAVRPWSEEDRRHFLASLRVAHVEFALSEVAYFAGPAGSPQDAELAYRSYLCGHPAGEAWALVERIGQKVP